MTTFELLTIEHAGAIATVTIRRPEKLNALNAPVIAELTRAFHGLIEQAARADAPGAPAEVSPVRAVVLTGAGKAFIAGADIAEMASMSTMEARHHADLGHALCALIESAPFPVIAAVNGFALGGGCEIALACDFIYAAEGAMIGQPEVALGIIPGFGGTQRLSRRVGLGHARELIYTGDMIPAERALAIGLVNVVAPLGELVARAQATALKIAGRGPAAVAAAKRVMRSGEGLGLPAACDLEVQTFAALFGTEDQRAGMKAFVEKSKAAFKGR